MNNKNNMWVVERHVFFDWKVAIILGILFGFLTIATAYSFGGWKNIFLVLVTVFFTCGTLRIAESKE
jgi:hypothetical protein